MFDWRLGAVFFFDIRIYSTLIILYSLTKGISIQEILKEKVQKMPLNFALLLSLSLNAEEYIL
jgi:hypothetical protein